MNVNDLPAAVAPDEDAALIVLVVFDAGGRDPGQHEGVANDGCIPIQLESWLPQVIAIVCVGARPGVVDHEQVEVQSILAVGRDKPFVKR
jgi:hypothetical protein